MNRVEWQGFSRTAVAVAVAMAAAASAPVLAQNTTSAINGTVTGADGKPLAGASVTIVHVESGSSNTVTTDAAGRYSARGLRAGGPYTVTVSKGGQSEKREDLYLSLAETFSYDAQIGGGTQVVTITGRGGSDRFNSSNIGAGTAIGVRELSAYASIQRSLTDYARTDPRLAQTDRENGQISAAGQNNRYNSITIDGVNISDTFGIEGNNLPTKKQPISIDAIQSVQVNLSNYDVTQKGYTGANINAVTKSGSNDLHGSVYYIWRDADLVGQRYNRATGLYTDAPAFKDDTKGFTLGGPIVKDKLFFFASYEEYKSTRSSPSAGPVGSGLSTTVGITQAAIDAFIDAARNTYSMDLGASAIPANLALTVKDSLLKLDWNISDSHRANVRYSKTEQSDPVISNFFGPTQLSLSSYWYTTKKEIETIVGQWFADWTPEISTEAKFSVRDYAQRHTPINGTRLPATRIAYTGGLPIGAPAGTNTGTRNLDGGTEVSRQFNVLDTKTTDIYLGANWNLGQHDLKFGADYTNNEIFNAFLQNVNGTYTFRCEGSTTPSSPVTYSFGRVGGAAAGQFAADCNALTSAQRDLAALENFQRGTPSSYTVQLPRAGRTIQDGAASFSVANTGVFVQDTWKPSKALSLTAGVRFDQQSVPDKPIANAAAAAAPVAGSISGATYTRATGGFGIDNTVTLDGTSLVQPRVGFNYNLGAERRAQLRGGVGLFQGAAATVWLSNPFSNTGAATVQFSCTTYNACVTANARFSPNPDTQPTLTGTPPAAAVDAISPNLAQPSVWKANLAFEAELPALPLVGSLVAGAEWLHTRTNSAIFLQHLNLGTPTRTGSDGRDLFYRAEGFDPNCYSVDTGGTASNVGAGPCATPAGQSRTRALSNASFANVILANKTRQGQGNALTLSLSQPASMGLGWGIAYTRTTATEVSPLTSSTSNSTWNTRAVFNPNEEVAANSNYAIRDRFSATASWSKAFVGDYKTSVGVFYEGRKGRPYSWTYINDLNGDGISGNDRMYIPSAPGSGEVVFKGGAAEEARFWAVVDANPGLAGSKGGVVGRNTSYAPWVNQVDLRLSQELPGFAKSHKAIFSVDFLNFGNLLNKKWGRIDEIDFPSRRSFVNYLGVDASGKYVYGMGPDSDFLTKNNANESQWQVQFTLRYQF